MARISGAVEPAIDVLHIYQAVECFYQNDFEGALVEYEQSLRIKDSSFAHLGRAITLISMGKYSEGFAEYPWRWKVFRDEMTPRGRHLYDTLPKWDGEPGKRVIILHEAGYGDTLQLLRYVPIVKEMSASVELDMPVPLQRLASQLAPLATVESNGCVVTTFELMSILKQTTETIPPPPYLRSDEALSAQWASRIGSDGRRRIGVTWSTKLGSNGEHYNQRRDIDAKRFVAALKSVGISRSDHVISLQTQERTLANHYGIDTYEIEDFADVAALVPLMDVVVSIDTAAAHVVGAVGHPRANVLLPYAATWRWLCGNPWYPNMNLCQQKFPGDWESCFEQVNA